MANFRLPEINTRFALPIICPTTGEEVSAETLYNRCCDAMGHVVRDHIGDLILDNLRYPEGETPDEQALCDAVYAWSASVRKQLPNEGELASLRFVAFQVVASEPDGRPIYSVVDIVEPKLKYRYKLLRQARLVAGPRGYVAVGTAGVAFDATTRRISGIYPYSTRGAELYR